MATQSEARIVLSAVDKTSAAFASAQKGLSGLGETAMSLKGALATLGLGAVGAALVSSVRAVANYRDELGKLAQRAGTTTEAISGLAYAASLSDVDNKTLAKGLRELGNDAAEGGKKLGELGIALNDASGKAKTSDALLLEVSDRLAGIEDPAKRAAVAAKVFGDRIGPELLPLLGGGSAAIKGMTDEAARFGKVVSDEAAAKAAEFNDNLTRLQARASGLSTTLASEVIPTLNDIVGSFLAAENGGNDFAKMLGGSLRVALEATSILAMDVGFVLATLGDTAGAYIAVSERLLKFDIAGAKAVGAAYREASEERRLALDTAQLRILAPALTSFTPEEARKRGLLGNKALPGSTVEPPKPKPPKPPKPLGAKSTPFTGTTYDEQITQRVGKLFEDSDLIKAQEYLDTLNKLDALYYSGAISGELYDSALKKLTGSTEQAGESSERLAQLLSGTASAALQQQRDDMQLLTEALEKGIITEELYLEAVTARLSLSKDADTTVSDLTKAIEGFGRQGADAFAEFAISGKSSFKDLANSVIADIIRMLAYKQLMQPLMGAISGGISGWMGSGAAAGSISNGMSQSAMLAAQVAGFSGGGYTGSGPRSGGMDGQGGFLAMLHPQETVVDHAKGQGASTQVVVNNYGSDKASAKETVDSRGNRRIEVSIGEMVAGEMRRTGSAPYNAVRQSFGATPALVGR